MLTKIKKIKSLGVFDSYAAPQELKGFERFNVVYGENGSPHPDKRDRNDDQGDNNDWNTAFGAYDDLVENCYLKPIGGLWFIGMGELRGLDHSWTSARSTVTTNVHSNASSEGRFVDLLKPLKLEFPAVRHEPSDGGYCHHTSCNQQRAIHDDFSSRTKE